MKTIRTRDTEDFKSLDMLRTVLSQSVPEKGIQFAEMKRRLRIDDALDASKDDGLGGRLIALEDADYQLLCELCASFPARIYHRGLVKLFEAVHAPLADQTPVGGAKPNGQAPADPRPPLHSDGA